MAKSWFRGHTVPPLDNVILIIRAEKNKCGLFTNKILSLTLFIVLKGLIVK